MQSHEDRTKLKPETLQYYRHLAGKNTGEGWGLSGGMSKPPVSFLSWQRS